MKIALVGFMGSGKSTVGKLLSEHLRVPLIDTDAEIEKRTGMSIPEIFKKKGEEYFRELERLLIEELLSLPQQSVISTGGGLPTYFNNMELLNQKAFTVYLEADFEVLWQRISEDKNRPLVLLGKERVRELFEKRRPFYERAKLRVKTDVNSPEACVEEILSSLSFL
ncbi:shikimate kinase [Phorcysia thermohydrogeniphila]|uniref:Shikimate kinase n=1 Tax=Phorcysia thermohydrogeniphila TaxID=936138 RepID=A0A4V2PDB5_9BACT|nr:shikimate kinase [Phorcysia thermohydrogeniphila]TCK04526.1 shikimate kinase [Phorcysia thermohydrogeniphila]